MKRIVLAREISSIHLRRANQLTVQPIGQAMVGTLNAPSKLALVGCAHACAAVTADVVERTEKAAGIARDDDAFATYIAQEILAGLANLLGSSSADPASEEESLHFLLEQFRICVIPGGQSFRGRVHHQNYGTAASSSEE